MRFKIPCNCLSDLGDFEPGYRKQILLLATNMKSKFSFALEIVHVFIEEPRVVFWIFPIILIFRGETAFNQ